MEGRRERNGEGMSEEVKEERDLTFDGYPREKERTRREKEGRVRNKDRERWRSIVIEIDR